MRFFQVSAVINPNGKGLPTCCAQNDTQVFVAMTAEFKEGGQNE
jgi:hypothetical protein